MRVVSEAEAIKNLHALLRDLNRHAVIINDGENNLGAIVSMKDHEIIRLEREEKFVAR